MVPIRLDLFGLGFVIGGLILMAPTMGYALFKTIQWLLTL